MQLKLANAHVYFLRYLRNVQESIREPKCIFTYPVLAVDAVKSRFYQWTLDLFIFPLVLFPPLFKPTRDSVVSSYCIVFNCSPVDESLGCFQSHDVANKAAVIFLCAFPGTGKSVCSMKS